MTNKQPKVQEVERYQELHAKAIEMEKKAIEILQNPKLLDRCIEEIQKKVVGEKETILTLLICANGRNVINHNIASYNLLINDESGLGKDFVTSSVCELLPDDEFVYRTKITPETFTYWHNPTIEPDWTWNKKVFYLEDAPSKIINSEPFKVMASKGSKATVLINQTPRDIEIKGKPVIFVTSANANPNEENLRRFPIINLDESEEQTIEIMKRKGIRAKTGKNTEYDIEIKDALRILQRVRVVIPFADKLVDFFPKNRFMRTHFERILDYIKSSTSLHQYQRKKDDNDYYIATGEDYNIARTVLYKTTSNPQMIPLTKDKQKIMNYFEKNPYIWYSVNDIENKFTFSDRWLRKQLDQLVHLGFLDKDKSEREGIKQKVMVYSYNKEKNSIDIPKFDVICSKDSNNSKHTKDSKDSKDKRTFESIESIEQESSVTETPFISKDEKIRRVEKRFLRGD